MIKAILVDDEKPALKELEFLLGKYPEVSVAGMYKNPFEAIEKIEQIKPEIVFLDINMPKLKGTDAASRILDVSPDTNIIFVTAYDQYAIEAFELHALDYLLKPVEDARFLKTMERVIRKPAVRETSDQKLRVKCLGRFQVTLGDREPIKWRAEKTKELFAYLLQNRNRFITKEELLDRLWMDENPEKAIRQLYNGIYYIRKALEEYGIGRNAITIGSNYNMALGDVELDVELFCEFEKGIRTENIEQLAELETLYSGDYLESEDYLWAELERTRYANLYMQCLARLSKMLMEKRQWNRAEIYLMKAYQKSPYEENITEMLVGLYLQSGSKGKALLHFKAYTELIREELGIKPGRRLLQLIQSVE